MTNKRFWLGILAMVLVFGMVVVGCDNGSTSGGKTYYYQIGGISVAAWNLINSNPGISAQRALAYCNQYPVIGDPYKEVKSGYTRSRLENDLDQISIPGFSKTQFLKMLDSGGAVFQMFSLINGDYIYCYVEEE